MAVRWEDYLDVGVGGRVFGATDLQEVIVVAALGFGGSSNALLFFVVVLAVLVVDMFLIVVVLERDLFGGSGDFCDGAIGGGKKDRGIGHHFCLEWYRLASRQVDRQVEGSGWVV